MSKSIIDQIIGQIESKVPFEEVCGTKVPLAFENRQMVKWCHIPGMILAPYMGHIIAQSALLMIVEK